VFALARTYDPGWLVMKEGNIYRRSGVRAFPSDSSQMGLPLN
jgi:hypothetical protein